MLPQAIAGAHIHMGTIAGKLNGVIPATTPKGWRIEYTSIPVEACSEKWPRSSVGIPQACSITSSPRCTSPTASDKTLPCSSVRIFAISSRCECTSSRTRNMMSVRFDSETARQLSNASLAAATACPTSSTDAKSTSPVCAPSAGL